MGQKILTPILLIIQNLPIKINLMKSLFKEFSKTSKKGWLAKVEKDLKGKPLENLDWQLNDDFVISPFAHADDIKDKYSPLVGKRNSNNWEKGVRINVSNYNTANQEALFLLEKGAEALCFEFKNNPTKKDLQFLLKNIELEWISTLFILPDNSWKRVLQNFISILKEKKQDASQVKFSFHFSHPTKISKKDFLAIQKYSAILTPSKLIGIFGAKYYPEKKDVDYNLALILRDVNQYFEQWNEKGLDLKDLISKFQVSISLTDSYFLNIAKIRALKVLWKMLLKAWKQNQNTPLTISVHLTEFTQTKNENYNKIKATAQSMSAVIGGVDQLYIYPSFSIKKKKEKLNQQRLGLNIQHLMELESHMTKVIDPSAGSYYIENLTDEIAERAWEKFKLL